MGKSLLFKKVNVLDVRHQEILKDTDVLVKDKRIAAVGKDLAEDADEIVDGEGLYLSPGIIDMHVHSTWDGSAISEDLDEKYGPYQAFLRSVQNVERSLKAGVTTIREVGSPKDLSVETAWAVNQGLIKGSRVIPCGSALQSVYGHVPSIGTIANTKDELLVAIRQKKALFVKKGIKCQWIKIMDTGGAAGLEDIGPSMYDQDQLQFIVHEVHRLHMKVAVHAVSQEGILECIKAGIDTIEHGPDIPDEYLDMMKEKNLTLIPTLAIYKILGEGEGVLSDFMVQRSQLVSRQQKSTFARARAKGVRIALGTDAGSPLFGPHPAAFKEMKVMNEDGMQEPEIISCATITAAEVLGLSDEIGSIEPGKYADFDLLSKNPYEDVAAYTSGMVDVYKEGEKVNQMNDSDF